jgi:hypothetical protein
VNATPIVTNLTAEMSNHALISFAQSMYVDNSQNPNPIHIQFGIQSINILAHVQGWLPVISQRPIIFSIDCPLASGTTSIVITNYPVAPFLYLTQ